jgi:glucosylceramidase
MKQNLSILLVLATAFTAAAQNKKAVKPVQSLYCCEQKSNGIHHSRKI